MGGRFSILDKVNELKTMSHARREKFLRLIDGDGRLAHYCYIWNHRKRCEEVVDWLIAHKMTGRVLHTFLVESYGPKMHEPFQWVLMKIDNLAEPPRIRAQDFERQNEL
jgi:hypothetical protein